ncbi:MAG: hypothetical protein ACI4OW_03725 [Alphaproteobacteria bacterium]
MAGLVSYQTSEKVLGDELLIITRSSRAGLLFCSWKLSKTVGGRNKV